MGEGNLGSGEPDVGGAGSEGAQGWCVLGCRVGGATGGGEEARTLVGEWGMERGEGGSWMWIPGRPGSKGVWVGARGRGKFGGQLSQSIGYEGS